MNNFYSTRKWQALKAKILKRDNRVCAMCGKQCTEKGDAVVDHKIRRRARPDLAYTASNLQTLCRHCHNSIKQRDELNPARGCDVNGLPNDGSWND